MDHYIKFLKKIGVPAATLEALKDEAADIETLATGFREDQNEILAAAIKPKLIDELKPEINKEALKSVHGSLKTRMNRELGLTIPDFRSMELDDYLAAAKTELENRVKTSTDAEIQAKIKAITDKYSETLEEASELKAKLSAKDAEVEAKIAEATGKLYAQKNIADAFAKVKLGGKPEIVEFVQKGLRDSIMASYRIAEDGSIKNLDGTPVVRDGSTIVKTVHELVQEDPAIKALIKQNDARGEDEPGGGAGGYDFNPKKSPDGKAINPNVDTEYAAQLLKELS